MKKKITIILISLAVLFPMRSLAQLIACRDSVPNGYNFWLYLPDDYDSAKADKPVVIFLHGKSLCGRDLKKVLRYGSIDALKRGREIDAVVIAPQSTGAWKPEKLMNVYKWVQDKYPIDTNRLYVLGMSLGGYGTLDFVATYPDKVAAAIAMCGGASVKSLCGLNDLPLWIIHGTADKAVPVRCSDRVVDSMRQCGDTARLIYDRMKGVNHSQLARVFYLDQTYDWLFAHSLADSARMTDKSYGMSTNILKEAYANLNKNFKLTMVDSKGQLQSAKEKVYYTVRKGDTLSKIAVDHQTTVTLLCKLNNMKRTEKLRIGRKLRVS